MIDAQLLQTIGAIATPLTGIATFAYGIARRKRLGSWLSSKMILIDERNTAIVERDGALRQAKTAEAANRNQHDSITALQTSLETLQATVAAHDTKLQQMQATNDAFVDWGHLMLEHSHALEAELKTNGIEPTSQTPLIPPILANRIVFPERLS